ncbi:MAG: hypothetical protein ABIQ66_07435 [Novosphingobium sp.]
MNDMQPPPAPRRTSPLLLGTAAAALAAIVVVFVLPAETGIDLTGLGETSGLTRMANPQAGMFLERGLKRKGVFTPTQSAPEAEPGVSDHWTHVLDPYEEIELKYVLDKGAPITFAWSADGPLDVDMHAHPLAGGSALTESYAVTKTNRQAGRYVAAFSGIHGWHWQNRSMTRVTLTLDASGKIIGSKLIDGRSEQDRQLTPKSR